MAQKSVEEYIKEEIKKAEKLFEGAKCQQERMYTEEEVFKMLLIKHDGLTPEYVLQQFKTQ